MLINTNIKRIVGGREIKEVRYMGDVVWSFKGPIITSFNDGRYFERVNNRMRLKREFYNGKASFYYPLHGGAKNVLYNATYYDNYDITMNIAYNKTKNANNNKLIYLGNMPQSSDMNLALIEFININPKYNIVLIFIHKDGIYDLEKERKQAWNYFKEVII